MNTLDVFSYKPSSGQLKQLNLLLGIISTCQVSGIKVWVIGGYALDALYGSLTRDHHDFDLYIGESSSSEFTKIIVRFGFQPTLEKAGQIGKKVYINPSFSPALRLELGIIEQGQEFSKKIVGESGPGMFMSYMKDTPLGSLLGKPVLTPTLEGLKKLMEVNDSLVKESGPDTYPFHAWRNKILAILEKKSHSSNRIRKARCQSGGR